MGNGLQASCTKAKQKEEEYEDEGSDFEMSEDKDSDYLVSEIDVSLTARRKSNGIAKKRRKNASSSDDEEDFNPVSQTGAFVNAFWLDKFSTELIMGCHDLLPQT